MSSQDKQELLDAFLSDQDASMEEQPLAKGAASGEEEQPSKAVLEEPSCLRAAIDCHQQGVEGEFEEDWSFQVDSTSGGRGTGTSSPSLLTRELLRLQSSGLSSSGNRPWKLCLQHGQHPRPSHTPVVWVAVGGRRPRNSFTLQ